MLYKVRIKVRIKDKWNNPGKGVAIEKGAFVLPLTMVGILTYSYMVSSIII